MIASLILQIKGFTCAQRIKQLLKIKEPQNDRAKLKTGSLSSKINGFSSYKHSILPIPSST